MKMSPEMRGIFQHVEALVRLLLVNPASSAFAERRFSSLRRLKTYLRCKIGQTRLNHVAVAHVHKTALDEAELKELKKQFVTYKENRMAVLASCKPYGFTKAGH